MVIAKHSFALPMDSSRYKIETANIEVAEENKSSDSYKRQYSPEGFTVKANFQVPFRFTISNTNINLGTLTSGAPSSSTTNLTVNFSADDGYQVTAVEEAPLKTQSGNIVADTGCDDGANPCNESSSKPWVSNSSYGFGYNISGDDVPTDFAHSSYYRPFPDSSASEAPITIMSNAKNSQNRQATVTFKSNISPIQPAGSYQTVINFVAMPSY